MVPGPSPPTGEPACTADDFDYVCPPELIAQHPTAERGASRLLVLGRTSGAVRHRTFPDFPGLLEPGDVLVLNTSRVIPARLIGRRDNGRPAEVLLVHPEPDGTWLAMVHPGGKLKTGRLVSFGAAGQRGSAAGATAEIVGVVGGGLRRVRFHGMDARAAMAAFGAVPLPPYIHHRPDADDRERYQTVYARQDGSVAAPTAGLHFTPEILDAIRARGVAVTEVVLHVGPGTFKPVEVPDLRQHVMHAEWYEISEEAAATINAARAAGGRVWAVGTTSVRVLETAARAGAARGGDAHGGAARGGGARVGDARAGDARVGDARAGDARGGDARAGDARGGDARGGDACVAPTDTIVRAGSGWTDIFIYPPYTFRAVDALLTNFHLPRSTLLMLVAAFAGREAVLRAYAEAIRERYRLYSYGDAMAVV